MRRRWWATVFQRDTGQRASGSRPSLYPVPRPPAELRPAVLPLAPVNDIQLDAAREILRLTPIVANPRDPEEPAWELAIALMELRRAAHVLSRAVRWCEEQHQ